MMILLIALIPAAVVFFIAVGTASKVKTTIAALIAAALGALTGNPAYMALDLLAVLVAYWAAMSMLGDMPKQARPPPVVAAPTPKPAVNESDSGSFSTVVVIAVFGFFAYLIFGPGNSHTPKNQQPPSTYSRPVVTVPRPHIASPVSPPSPQEPKKHAKRPPKSPLQRCLEIRSEDKMAECLARLD